MKVAVSPLSRNRLPLEGKADDTGIPSAKMAAKPLLICLPHYYENLSRVKNGAKSTPFIILY
mgnify:CR=1 FL=1